MAFQKGNQLSKGKGRPKQTLESIFGRKLTLDEFQAVATKLLDLHPSQVMEKSTNPNSTALETWLSGIILDGIEKRDEQKLDMILNRLLGKIPIIQINQQTNIENQNNVHLELAEAEQRLKTVMDQAIKERESAVINERILEPCLEASKSTTG